MEMVKTETNVIFLRKLARIVSCKHNIIQVIALNGAQSMSDVA